MDKSSRNIVIFIGAITVAVLLIMAARFYTRSQEEPMPAVAEEATKAEALPVETTDDPLADPAEEVAAKTGIDPENPDEVIVEEDAELIMGEPSMNLENGGATIYLPQTPPPAEAQAE